MDFHIVNSISIDIELLVSSFKICIVFILASNVLVLSHAFSDFVDHS
jgi:hypothetical protein